MRLEILVDLSRQAPGKPRTSVSPAKSTARARRMPEARKAAAPATLIRAKFAKSATAAEPLRVG
jgi:hypothetical protein